MAQSILNGARGHGDLPDDEIVVLSFSNGVVGKIAYEFVRVARVYGIEDPIWLLKRCEELTPLGRAMLGEEEPGDVDQCEIQDHENRSFLRRLLGPWEG